MKKILAMLLALALMASLAACGGSRTGNQEQDYILSLLEEGDYDTAIRVLEVLRDRDAGHGEPAGEVPGEAEPPAQPGISGGAEEDEVRFEGQPECTGTDWRFVFSLTNGRDERICLERLEFLDRWNGQPSDGPHVLNKELLESIGLGDVELDPGESFSWEDWHPVEPGFEHRDVSFIFRTDSGREVRYTFSFDLSGGAAAQPSAAVEADDGSRDLKYLRHGANYCTEVFPGVFWVPANTLGGSRYTNGEIRRMLPESPESKQEKISTLYEALQLYQLGNFTASDDNIRMEENGLNWEHHKPGYHAVRTNTGCCATDSNWLRYVLDGDYEETGFLATSQRDGSGHVYNYIFQDGWYYFIDLTHYRADATGNQNGTEDGDLDAYYRTDFVLGNLHRAQDVQSFVDYVQQSFGDPPALMVMYTAENVLAVDSMKRGGVMNIVYEEADGTEIRVLFAASDGQTQLVREPSPTKRPDWDRSPVNPFPD